MSNDIPFHVSMTSNASSVATSRSPSSMPPSVRYATTSVLDTRSVRSHVVRAMRSNGWPSGTARAASRMRGGAYSSRCGGTAPCHVSTSPTMFTASAGLSWFGKPNCPFISPSSAATRKGGMSARSGRAVKCLASDDGTTSSTWHAVRRCDVLPGSSAETHGASGRSAAGRAIRVARPAPWTRNHVHGCRPSALSMVLSTGSNSCTTAITNARAPLPTSASLAAALVAAPAATPPVSAPVAS